MSQNKRYAGSARPVQRSAGGQNPRQVRRPPTAQQAGYARSAQQTGYVRPAQPSRSGTANVRDAVNVGSRRFRSDILKLAVGGVVAVLLALALQHLWPDGFPISSSQKVNGAAKQISEIHSAGPLRINEIMTANRYTLRNSDDESSDWIEVSNVSDSSVNLAGWELSKTANSAAVFTFPDMNLAPGESVVVCADSRLRETAGEELHAPFRLSSGGDTLMLFNIAGTAVDTVNIPALNRDQSYARKGVSDWEVSNMPTPGLENSEAAYQEMRTDSADSAVILTEIVSSNGTTLADENGQYNDYIELYNRSGVAVSLSGWYLSDDEVNTRKWRFPDVTIDPGQTLIVFASGLDKKGDPAHLHTNFSLSGEGEQVILSDASGRRMSSTTFDLLKTDVAWQRAADGTWSAGTPTPGQAN